MIPVIMRTGRQCSIILLLVECRSLEVNLI